MLARVLLWLYRIFWFAFAYLTVLTISTRHPGLIISANICFLAGWVAFELFYRRFPDGDDDWPFVPKRHLAKPIYWPELLYLVRLHLIAINAIYLILLIPGILASTSAFDWTFWEAVWQALYLTNFWFAQSLFSAWVIASGKSRNGSGSELPHSLRERRARFYENWPNVDGWG